jgi:DNA helicase HerA-like ATPase
MTSKNNRIKTNPAIKPMSAKNGNGQKGIVAPAGLDQQTVREGIGAIVKGSLQTGLSMKLDGASSVEEMRAGKFVVIDGAEHDFFAMITDVALEAATPAILAHPPTGGPGSRDETLRRILSGTSTYGTLTLRPMLMRSKGSVEDFGPVRTVPVHFSAVSEATAGDVSAIFGEEDGENGRFYIGSPLDMEDIEVCLDLKKLAERSNGIFGKSGTGKSFLTRICLCGLIKHKAAVNLVFDMHNEYGWKGSVEDASRESVRGLKQYFDSQVAVFTMDPDSARRRQVQIENRVTIPYSQVTVEDILLLADELNLTPTAAETTYLLEQRYGAKWLKSLLSMDGTEAQKEFCDASGAHPASVGALRRKLSRMVEDCKGFLIDELAEADDAVKQILSHLLKGTNIVLEFGQYRKPLQYMLVANILTRRIHAEYTRRMEEAGDDRGRQPTPLVITIEEAHKFLNPTLSHQTIFGTIAREMRKYNVTLLIVDQRPSGIDDEVLSQLGTRITCLLNDEKDIDAVLTGVPTAHDLRGVLASLDTKQQALLLGHAVPMPVVVKTRDYDSDEFRRSMGSFRQVAEMSPSERKQALKDLQAEW